MTPDRRGGEPAEPVDPRGSTGSVRLRSARPVAGTLLAARSARGVRVAGVPRAVTRLVRGAGAGLRPGLGAALRLPGTRRWLGRPAGLTRLSRLPRTRRWLGAAELLS